MKHIKLYEEYTIWNKIDDLIVSLLDDDYYDVYYEQLDDFDSEEEKEDNRESYIEDHKYDDASEMLMKLYTWGDDNDILEILEILNDIRGSYTYNGLSSIITHKLIQKYLDKIDYMGLDPISIDIEIDEFMIKVKVKDQEEQYIETPEELIEYLTNALDWDPDKEV